MTRPVPVPDHLTSSYWAHAREQRLALPQCSACGKFHFYPRPACPHCGADKISWSPVSGIATVYSYSVVWRAPSPAFRDDLPYVIAIVRAEEGPHLLSRIDVDPEAISVGLKVRARFEPLSDEISLPVFIPVEEP